MSATENKALIQRVFAEIWNAGNLALIDELFAPDYRRHGAPPDTLPGPEGERQHRAAFRTAFPDLVITAEDLIAEGDRVVVRYTWRGTYQGTWPGVPSKGQAVTMTGIAIHRLVEGKITDRRVGQNMRLWQNGGEGTTSRRIMRLVRRCSPCRHGG